MKLVCQWLYAIRFLSGLRIAVCYLKGMGKVIFHHDRLRELFAYGIVAIFVSAIYFVLAICLVEKFNINSTLASVLSYVASFILSFFFNHHWVFKSNKNQSETFARFLIVSAFCLCLTTAIMFLVVNVIELPYKFALAIVMVVIPLHNYLLNSLWAFKKR